MQNDKVTIGEITFEYGAHLKFERYSHVDNFAVLWQVSRKLDGPDTVNWHGSAHRLKNPSLDLTLLIGEDPDELLVGLTELIKLSNWLRDETAPTNSPRNNLTALVTIESAEAAKVDIKIKCRSCGNIGILRVESFDLLTQSPSPVKFENLYPDSIPAISGLLENGICPACSIWSEDQTDETGDGGLS